MKIHAMNPDLWLGGKSALLFFIDMMVLLTWAIFRQIRKDKKDGAT